MIKTSHKCSGYTLLELMITLFILSILVMISLPMYLNYQTRSKITEGVNLFTGVKNNIVEHYYSTGSWPNSNTEAGAPSPNSFKTRYVESLEIKEVSGQGGSVVITYNSTAIVGIGSNNTLIFYPTGSNGRVIWQCDRGSLSQRLRPPNCR